MDNRHATEDDINTASQRSFDATDSAAVEHGRASMSVQLSDNIELASGLSGLILSPPSLIAVSPNRIVESANLTNLLRQQAVHSPAQGRLTVAGQGGHPTRVHPIPLASSNAALPVRTEH